MNQRERLLIVGVLALIILAGGWFVVQNLVLAPLDARKATLAALEKDVQTRSDRQDQIKAGLVKLERWRQLSLPADEDLARREYETYLTELLRESNFAQGSSVTPRPVDHKSSPQLSGKGPVYTKLIFGIQGRATLENLVKMQEHFYRTGLLHQIKNLTIQRPLTTTPQQRPRELDVTMTVEALIVAGAENRQALLPLDKRLLAAEFGLLGAPPRGVAGLATAVAVASPTGPLTPGALAQPPRNYSALAAKNIFLGPAPPVRESTGDTTEVTRFVHLIDITHTVSRDEALLYNRYTNQYTRLASRVAFKDFVIRDGNGDEMIKGQVVKLLDREVIVLVNEKHYAIHVGQSVDEALRKPLAADRLKELGLKDAAAKEEPKPTEEVKKP